LKQESNHLSKKKYSDAKNLLKEALDIVPGLTSLRLLRAKSSFYLGDCNEVLEDTMRLLKVKPNDLEAILFRGHCFRNMGQLDEASQLYTTCLTWDPHHDQCRAASDAIAKFRINDSQARNLLNGNRATEAMPIIEQCLKYLYDENIKFFVARILVLKCSAFVKMNQPDEALSVCNEALSLDSAELQAYSLKGESYILKEQYEEAVQSYQKAVDAGDQSARSGLENAKKLLKISKRKDYYKILEVEKTSSPKEIKKAYHKLALQWHPDKNKENPEADAKFTDILEAYVVISDEEKRGKYDRGEDLEEHPQQQWNPFQGFNFQFRHG